MPGVKEVMRVDGASVARKLLIGVVLLQFVLLLGDYVFNYLDVLGDISIRRIFNIAREGSLPSWLASAQAGALALTAWFLTRVDRDHRRGWLGVSLFFLYIGLDDAAEIHERVGSALGRLADEGGWIADYPSFAWQIFLAPLLAAGLLATATFLWFRAPTGRKLVVFALGAFAVAQGLDYLEGVEGLLDGWAEGASLAAYTVNHGSRALEEMLEMLATTALWAPMLWKLVERTKGTEIHL